MGAVDFDRLLQRLRRSAAAAAVALEELAEAAAAAAVAASRRLPGVAPDATPAVIFETLLRIRRSPAAAAVDVLGETQVLGYPR